MLPKYNQQQWVAIKATVEADSEFIASTKSCHYTKGSTAALPTTSSTAGAWLSYMAFDEPNNKIKMLYACSS